MNWIKCTEKLPEANKRYLGYCKNDYGHSTWSGIVEVWFCPETGWKRCEDRDERSVRVLFWREMIDFPGDQEK